MNQKLTDIERRLNYVFWGAVIGGGAMAINQQLFLVVGVAILAARLVITLVWVHRLECEIRELETKRTWLD